MKLCFLQMSNVRLVKTLRRHFKIVQDEEMLWKSYNEYSIRFVLICLSVAAAMEAYIFLSEQWLCMLLV